MRLRLTIVLLAGLAAPGTVGFARAMTLPEAIQAAVERSPARRAAEARVEEARQALGQARAVSYPRLDLGSAWTRGDGPVYAFSSLLDQRSFTQENFAVESLNHPGYVTNIRSYARVGLPLFTGYEITSAEQLARLNLTAAEAAADGVRQEIRSAVWEAGIHLLRAEAAARVLDERIAASEGEVAGARRLRDRGLVLGSDYYAAEGVLAGLKARRIRETHAAEAARATLAVFVGEGAGALSGALRPGGPDLPSAQALAALAGERRPDLRAARIQTLSAEPLADRERSGLYPRVDAMAQAETNTEDFSSNPGARLVMLRAEWALGDPGYAARRDRVKAGDRAGREALEAVQDRAEIEILQAVHRARGAQASLPVLDAMVEHARRSLELFRPLYREGRQSILDVLRAEEALAQAESVRLETLAEMHLAHSRALSAAGVFDEASAAGLGEALSR